jgi:hypothetical protein
MVRKISPAAGAPSAADLVDRSEAQRGSPREAEGEAPRRTRRQDHRQAHPRPLGAAPSGRAPAPDRCLRGHPLPPPVGRTLYPANYVAPPPPPGAAAPPKPVAEPAPRVTSLLTRRAFNGPQGPFNLMRPHDLKESVRQQLLDEEAYSHGCTRLTFAVLFSTLGVAAAVLSGAMLGTLAAAMLGTAAVGMAYWAAEAFRSAAAHSDAAARARTAQCVSPLTIGTFTDGGVVWPNPYLPDCDEAKLVAFRIDQAATLRSFSDCCIEGVYLEQILNASIQLFSPAATVPGSDERRSVFEYRGRCNQLFAGARHAYVIYEPGHFQTLTQIHDADIDMVTNAENVSTAIAGRAVDVAADGDCFFSAVFQSLEGRLPSAVELADLRRQVAAKMAADNLGSVSDMMAEARGAFSRHVKYLGFKEVLVASEA